MAYRFLDPNPVYFELDGTLIAANGSLQFFNRSTTTPKTTFNSAAMSTANANPVPLDAAGRASTEIWLSGDYTVVLRDDLGATVWTRDVLDSASGGTTIPTLVSGEFLTNDGINLQWDAIRQVPDPTGQANKVLGTDGANLIWENKPAAPTLPITVYSNGIGIGDGTNTFRILQASATGVNAGGRFQTVNVTFPITFTATPSVSVQLTNASQVSGFGNNPSSRISSVTTTGFTVVWTMGELDDGQSGFDFNAAVSFVYTAMGRATA